MRLQAMMATYGIQTQTPHEVEPVQIWSSTQLVKVYQQLGVNNKVGLTGRPNRPIGSLGTSKVYRVCGMTVLCYPLIFEVSDFYLYRDMALLIGMNLLIIIFNWLLTFKVISCYTQMILKPNYNLLENTGGYLDVLQYVYLSVKSI